MRKHFGSNRRCSRLLVPYLLWRCNSFIYYFGTYQVPTNRETTPRRFLCVALSLSQYGHPLYDGQEGQCGPLPMFNFRDFSSPWHGWCLPARLKLFRWAPIKPSRLFLVLLRWRRRAKLPRGWSEASSLGAIRSRVSWIFFDAAKGPPRTKDHAVWNYVLTLWTLTCTMCFVNPTQFEYCMCSMMYRLTVSRCCISARLTQSNVTLICWELACAIIWCYDFNIFGIDVYIWYHDFNIFGTTVFIRTLQSLNVLTFASCAIYWN